MTKLSHLGDRLEWLNDVMEWHIFEESLDRVKPDKTQGGKGGRPPYSNISVDKVSKIITSWRVTAANVNDIEMFLALLEPRDREIWADSGYASAVLVELLEKHCPDLKLHICEKGQRNHPLTDEQKPWHRPRRGVAFHMNIAHISCRFPFFCL